MSETTQTYKNYIGGEWVAAADGRTTENRDPATGELLGHFPRSGQADVERAVAAAKDGLRGLAEAPPRPSAARSSTVWARCSPSARKRSRASSPARWAKCSSRRAATCRKPSTWPTTWPARGAGSSAPSCPSELPNKAAYGVRDPLGVIGCVTPWNFPVAIPSWKMHGRADRRQHRRPQAGDRHATLGADNYVEAFADAGLPPGVLNLVMGSGAEVGHAAGPAPRRGGHLVHRLERGRARGERRGGAGLQARHAGDGRQERDHRAWTTPTSIWRSRASSGAPSARPGSAAPPAAG